MPWRASTSLMVVFTNSARAAARGLGRNIHREIDPAVARRLPFYPR